MVNSESFDSDGNHQAKDCITQPNNGADSSHSPSPVTATAACLRESDYTTHTADSLPVSQAIEPTATKTEFNSTMSNIFLGGNEGHVAPKSEKSIAERDSGLMNQDGTRIDKDECLAQPNVEGEQNATPDDDDSDSKTSLFVSLPLNKIQDALGGVAADASCSETKPKKISKKLMCLYCDRTFVTPSLRQKHVDRCHSVKQNRRASSRIQNQQSTTACLFCGTFNNKEHSLRDLFEHLVKEHPTKYYGCLQCEDRYLTQQQLQEHNGLIHGIPSENTELDDAVGASTKDPVLESKSAILSISDDISDKKTIPKPKQNPKVSSDAKDDTSTNETSEESRLISDESNSTNSIAERTLRKRPALRRHKHISAKVLRNKKISVKSTKLNLKRTTRLQAKTVESTKQTTKKRPLTKVAKQKPAEPTTSAKVEKPQPKNSFFSLENIFIYKKITDHSIDNLRITSLTFDDVFDKAFFNRMNSNIQDNLLNHIDGKLFKNEESENRISNFEKTPPDAQPNTSESYGCEISINAATPVPSSLLTSQMGEDIESQIEYGSKASKKKTPPVKNDEVHYKYFTRRKYQASLKANNEHRDLSKLDMWTQLIVKNRLQKVVDNKKSDKEMVEYTNCAEYKAKIRLEELNRILDKRGPFEDLKEEANKKAALDKLNECENDENVDPEVFSDVRAVLGDLLETVSRDVDSQIKQEILEISELDNATPQILETDKEIEMPSFLNLRRTSSLANEPDVDQSDKITLICSSQETENFEEFVTPRDKNKLVELTGEWTRSRLYICAACGFKLPSIKLLMEHKNIIHPNVLCQHYEFVGNQSELYRHLSIPALGKVGDVEDNPKCKMWKRSDARTCTKCQKQCNSLGELHRHILECGEDWSWMLCRKKCKYKPFGAKTRRKRRGLIKRIFHREYKRQDEAQTKKKYAKKIEGPRSKPSDAETIQRMLANLPAKRATRKIVCLRDGIQRPRKIQPSQQNIKINSKQKVSFVKPSQKSAKMSLRQRNKAALLNSTVSEEEKMVRRKIPERNSKCNPALLRKSFRNLNKVFASKILDTNASLPIKRTLKNILTNKKSYKKGGSPPTPDLSNVEDEIKESPPSTSENEEKPSLLKSLIKKTIKRKKDLEKEANNLQENQEKKDSEPVQIPDIETPSTTPRKKMIKKIKTSPAIKKIKELDSNLSPENEVENKSEEKTNNTTPVPLKPAKSKRFKNVFKKPKSTDDNIKTSSKLENIGKKIMRSLSLRKTKKVPETITSEAESVKSSESIAESSSSVDKISDSKAISGKRKTRNSIKKVVKKMKISSKVDNKKEINPPKTREQGPFLEVTTIGDPPNIILGNSEVQMKKSDAALCAVNDKDDGNISSDDSVSEAITKIIAKKSAEMSMGSTGSYSDYKTILKETSGLDDISLSKKGLPIEKSKSESLDLSKSSVETIKINKQNVFLNIPVPPCTKIFDDKQLDNVKEPDEDKPIDLSMHESTKKTEECTKSSGNGITLPSFKFPIIDDKIKNKRAKRSKGLNDCIAMLTSKLQQNNETPNSIIEISNNINIPTNESNSKSINYKEEIEYSPTKNILPSIADPNCVVDVISNEIAICMKENSLMKEKPITNVSIDNAFQNKIEGNIAIEEVSNIERIINEVAIGTLKRNYIANNFNLMTSRSDIDLKEALKMSTNSRFDSFLDVEKLELEHKNNPYALEVKSLDRKSRRSIRKHENKVVKVAPITNTNENIEDFVNDKSKTINLNDDNVDSIRNPSVELDKKNFVKVDPLLTSSNTAAISKRKTKKTLSLPIVNNLQSNENLTGDYPVDLSINSKNECKVIHATESTEKEEIEIKSNEITVFPKSINDNAEMVQEKDVTIMEESKTINVSEPPKDKVTCDKSEVIIKEIESNIQIVKPDALNISVNKIISEVVATAATHKETLPLENESPKLSLEEDKSNNSNSSVFSNKQRKGNRKRNTRQTTKKTIDKAVQNSINENFQTMNENNYVKDEAIGCINNIFVENNTAETTNDKIVESNIIKTIDSKEEITPKDVTKEETITILNTKTNDVLDTVLQITDVETLSSTNNPRNSSIEDLLAPNEEELKTEESLDIVLKPELTVTVQNESLLETSLFVPISKKKCRTKKLKPPTKKIDCEITEKKLENIQIPQSNNENLHKASTEELKLYNETKKDICGVNTDQTKIDKNNEGLIDGQSIPDMIEIDSIPLLKRVEIEKSKKKSKGKTYVSVLTKDNTIKETISDKNKLDELTKQIQCKQIDQTLNKIFLEESIRELRVNIETDICIFGLNVDQTKSVENKVEHDNLTNCDSSEVETIPLLKRAQIQKRKKKLKGKVPMNVSIKGEKFKDTKSNKELNELKNQFEMKDMPESKNTALLHVSVEDFKTNVEMEKGKCHINIDQIKEIENKEKHNDNGDNADSDEIETIPILKRIDIHKNKKKSKAKPPTNVALKVENFKETMSDKNELNDMKNKINTEQMAETKNATLLQQSGERKKKANVERKEGKSDIFIDSTKIVENKEEHNDNLADFNSQNMETIPLLKRVETQKNKNKSKSKLPMKDEKIKETIIDNNELNDLTKKIKIKQTTQTENEILPDDNEVNILSDTDNDSTISDVIENDQLRTPKKGKKTKKCLPKISPSIFKNALKKSNKLRKGKIKLALFENPLEQQTCVENEESINTYDVPKIVPLETTTVKAKPYKSIIAPSKLNIISFDNPKLSSIKSNNEVTVPNILPKLDNDLFGSFKDISPPIGTLQKNLYPEKMTFNFFPPSGLEFPKFNCTSNLTVSELFHKPSLVSDLNISTKQKETKSKAIENNDVPTKRDESIKKIKEKIFDVESNDNKFFDKVEVEDSPTSDFLKESNSIDSVLLAIVPKDDETPDISVTQKHLKKKLISNKKKIKNQKRKIGSRHKKVVNKVDNIEELNSNENSELENLTPDIFNSNKILLDQAFVGNTSPSPNNVEYKELTVDLPFISKLAKTTKRKRKIGQKRTLVKKSVFGIGFEKIQTNIEGQQDNEIITQSTDTLDTDTRSSIICVSDDIENEINFKNLNDNLIKNIENESTISTANMSKRKYKKRSKSTPNRKVKEDNLIEINVLEGNCQKSTNSMFLENEPLILENKSINSPLNKICSDSEDEVPLSSLVKSSQSLSDINNADTTTAFEVIKESQIAHSLSNKLYVDDVSNLENKIRESIRQSNSLLNIVIGSSDASVVSCEEDSKPSKIDINKSQSNIHLSTDNVVLDESKEKFKSTGTKNSKKKYSKTNKKNERNENITTSIETSNFAKDDFKIEEQIEILKANDVPQMRSADKLSTNNGSIKKDDNPLLNLLDDANSVVPDQPMCGSQSKQSNEKHETEIDDVDSFYSRDSIMSDFYDPSENIEFNGRLKQRNRRKWNLASYIPVTKEELKQNTRIYENQTIESISESKEMPPVHETEVAMKNTETNKHNFNNVLNGSTFKATEPQINVSIKCIIKKCGKGKSSGDTYEASIKEDIKPSFAPEIDNDSDNVKEEIYSNEKTNRNSINCQSIYTEENQDKSLLYGPFSEELNEVMPHLVGKNKRNSRKTNKKRKLPKDNTSQQIILKENHIVGKEHSQVEPFLLNNVESKSGASKYSNQREVEDTNMISHLYQTSSKEENLDEKKFDLNEDNNCNSVEIKTVEEKRPSIIEVKKKNKGKHKRSKHTKENKIMEDNSNPKLIDKISKDKISLECFNIDTTPTTYPESTTTTNTSGNNLLCVEKNQEAEDDYESSDFETKIRIAIMKSNQILNINSDDNESKIDENIEEEDMEIDDWRKEEALNEASIIEQAKDLNSFDKPLFENADHEDLKNTTFNATNCASVSDEPSSHITSIKESDLSSTSAENISLLESSEKEDDTLSKTRRTTRSKQNILKKTLITETSGINSFNTSQELLSNTPSLEPVNIFNEPKQTIDLHLPLETSDQLLCKKEIKTKLSVKNKKAICSQKAQKTLSEEKLDNYCDICNKKFVRNENLVKHKMTFTHIAKLSEIEAREAAEKAKIQEESSNSVPIPIPEENVNSLDMGINLTNILHNTDSPAENLEINNLSKNVLVPNVLKSGSNTLKLADIINDVLNKPVETTNNFSEILLKNNQPDTKRYKSLGERKSFDSDTNINFSLTNYPSDNIADNISTSKMTTTDEMLEKQISLLENIIEENHASFKYIDDISISSNKSENYRGQSPISDVSDSKLSDSNQIPYSNVLPETKQKQIPLDNFVKPIQYEEISDDSTNVKAQFEENRSRKALNRDEELFLECCSLLKSSSEMSGYSKKSNRNGTSHLKNNFNFKQIDEPDWLEQKGFNPTDKKFQTNCSNFGSDASRINTPIGESFADDYSNSNTISTEWQTKTNTEYNNPKQKVMDDIAFEKRKISESDNKNGACLNNFKMINFGKDISDINAGEDNNDEKEVEDTFDHTNTLPSKLISSENCIATVDAVESKKEKRRKTTAATSEVPKPEFAVPYAKTQPEEQQDKKIITKGALKVFEGLKVSIPTEELDMKEVLNCSPNSKKVDNEIEIPDINSVKSASDEKTGSKVNSIKSTLKKFGNRLGLKITKKKEAQKKKTQKSRATKSDNKKSYDVYDFEETQDNTDIFSKDALSGLRAFRNQNLEKRTDVKDVFAEASPSQKDNSVESDSESNRYLDNYPFEAQSFSSYSSNSDVSAKKDKDKNITKNKCMIMGRIFKNAAKTKGDEAIREIPELNQSQIVENYVMNCSKYPEGDVKKNKLSDQEMNLLFDKLLEDKPEKKGEFRVPLPQPIKVENSKPSSTKKIHTTSNKPKAKIFKPKKRSKHNDDSSDDEFNINKPARKRNKKNSKKDDESINLEQELRECIGVASRKSQRKCTSGKQNVLIEFWSSDESNFDAILEAVASTERVEKKEILKTQELSDSSSKVEEPTVTSEEPVIEYDNSKSNESLAIVVQNVNNDIQAQKSVTEKPKANKRKSTKKRSKSKDANKVDKRPRKSVTKNSSTDSVDRTSRRKRSGCDTLYYWSSSSEDDFEDLIEVKPIREENEDEDRPMQHGWIVGDSPKKLVTMLAQAKGKKVDADGVKEQNKKRSSV